MFSKSLDNKSLFTNADGESLYDITESMYSRRYDMLSVHSIYKANRQCEMRPDYLSACLYGDEAYAEIVIKSAMIANPFSLEMGDLVYAMTLDNIYNDVKESKPTEEEGKSLYELVKRYHKYIDKNKVPEAAGSEENKVEALSDRAKPALEPNISKTGDTGIVVKNGKIYFGKNKSEADKIPTKTPEISDGMSALETGSFAPSVTENMTQEDEDDYLLEAMLEVNDDDELEFNIDDDIEEDFGKYSAANVSPNNNIILNGTKVFFTGGEGGESSDSGGDGTEIEGDLIIPVNSDEVDCAKSGISLGKFLSASVSSCKPNVEQ